MLQATRIFVTLATSRDADSEGLQHSKTSIDAIDFEARDLVEAELWNALMWSVPALSKESDSDHSSIASPRETI